MITEAPNLLALFPLGDSTVNEKRIRLDLVNALPGFPALELPLDTLTKPQTERLKEVKLFWNYFRKASNGVVHPWARAGSVLQPGLCSLVPLERSPSIQNPWISVVAG